MTNATLEDWAQALVAASPRLDREQQRIAIQTYHLLAHGEPAAPARIGEAVGVSAGRVEQVLRSWPLVFWDDKGRVIGFWGLAIDRLEPTHAMEVNGTTVYGWCAWDTLFITPILGTATHVESTDPHNGTTIRLTVTPHGVTSIDPPDAVVSFLLPEDRFTDDAILGFCHQIHFFSAPESAEAWMADRPGTFSLPVVEAYQLGKLTNRLRLGIEGGQGSTGVVL